LDVWIPELVGDPVPHRPRVLTPLQEGQLGTQVQQWLSEGVVEETSGLLWWNNPVFVEKKNGTIRVCIDCRPANAVTKDFDWPLPKLQELRHQLEGTSWYTRIDLRNAFFRLAVPKEWRHLTAFKHRSHTYQFTRMPFGLKTAPALFQRYMDHVLRRLRRICYWWFDDILVYARTEGELRRNAREVEHTLIRSGNEINKEKSEYNKQGILFAGLWVYARGTGPNLDKVKEALALPPPRTKKEKQSALGLVSYLRDFIPLVALLTADLYPGRNNTIDQEEYEKLWRRLMRHVCKSVSTLGHWKEKEDADLYTDASGTGAAVVLIQNGRIIALSSRKLSPTEQRYSTTDREHLSLLLASQRFRMFLHRKEGVTRVRNDHAALINRRTNDMTPRQTRWYLAISQWIPTIEHVKGELNPADFFSRWPVEIFGGQLSNSA
jgi:hypothetical protein